MTEVSVKPEPITLKLFPYIAGEARHWDGPKTGRDARCCDSDKAARPISPDEIALDIAATSSDSRSVLRPAAAQRDG